MTVFFIISGCGTHSRVHNTFNDSLKKERRYAVDDINHFSKNGDIFLALSFSGGGTRAAAFSYGVLSELRDTLITEDNDSVRLLDEVDYISSVSGGSFTSAYYGLFGEKIFEDFETVFLRQNVQKTLINSIFSPINWFRLFSSGFDRTSIAIEYYDDHIFQEKTFSDINKQGPFIQINATDLRTGQSFGFTQESFDLLCSNLDDFKIARAVAASSAVPVAFAPITLKNYPGCEDDFFLSGDTIETDISDDIRMQGLIRDMSTFSDKEHRQYIHLVDGGIADNLGVRSMVYRMLLLNEARKRAGSMKVRDMITPKYFVVIVVNAETSRALPMEQSPVAPSAVQVISAVSTAQISRYNLETISQTRKIFSDAAMKLSSEGKEVQPYFIELKFNDILDVKMRNVFNNMATSFALPDEQVDLLIDSGRQLLKDAPEFQKLLQDLKKDSL